MPRLLIVGGGISGLTLFVALDGYEATIDIVERSSCFEPVGSGIVLHPNGMSILERLGLAQEISDMGAQIRYLELTRESSVLRIPLEQVWAGAEQPTIALQRADLHSVLVQRAVSRHNDELHIRLGCALIGLETDEHQAVAHFSDGSTAAYDLVVGADGVGSVVRQAVWPESDIEHLGLLFWRFCASNTIGLPSDVWRTIERPNLSFGFIPLGHDRVHCFVQLVLTGDKPYQSGEEHLFLESNVAASEQVLAGVMSARIGAIHAGPALSVRVPSWRRGRCVLLGDAAHALSPTFSQGGVACHGGCIRPCSDVANCPLYRSCARTIRGRSRLPYRLGNSHGYLTDQRYT